MEYAIGIIAAAAVGLLGSLAGFDKERSFYPVVLIVVASYYILFAAMAQSPEVLIAEVIPMLVFTLMAILGFRHTHWLVAAGLAAHGVFDLVHGSAIANPGVPAWWPGFCLAFDITMAAYLAALLVFRSARNAA
jgi:hypothetical protein